MAYFPNLITKFDPSNMSAFGTLETADLTPVVQLDFVYGINTQTGLSTTSGTGATVDTDAGRLRIQSGTSSTGYGIFRSRKFARYRAGQGMVARFTAVFAAATASCKQIVGVGNFDTTAPVDGYFFGYNGNSYGILHKINGTEYWTAQASWNVDPCNGGGPSAFTINPQYGNVYMIKYPYLGYGDIEFFVEEPISGRFILVHVIRYANTTATLQLTNPALNFYAQIVNSGNTSNRIIYVGSIGIFVSGQRSFVGNPKWAYHNSKTGITTETVMFSVKNCTTYNGITNRGVIRLMSMSFGCNSNANRLVHIHLRLGATIGGSPSYTTINGTSADQGVTITSGNSISSVDVAGTTATGGLLLHCVSSINNGSMDIDLVPFDLFVTPGEIMTVSADSNGSADFAASLNWSEDI